MSDSIGGVSAYLKVDTEEAVNSLKTLTQFANASKQSLQGLFVDSKGTFRTFEQSMSGVAGSTDKAATSFRQFFREQRLQDRIAREGSQSILALASALAFMSSGSTKANTQMQVLQSSLFGAVAAANATEFALFSVGRMGNSLPGTFGKVASSLGAMAGEIGLLVAIGAGLISFFSETGRAAKAAAENGLRQYWDIIDSIAGSEYRLGLRGRAATLNELQSSADLAKSEYLRISGQQNIAGASKFTPGDVQAAIEARLEGKSPDGRTLPKKTGTDAEIAAALKAWRDAQEKAKAFEEFLKREDEERERKRKQAEKDRLDEEEKALKLEVDRQKVRDDSLGKQRDAVTAIQDYTLEAGTAANNEFQQRRNEAELTYARDKAKIEQLYMESGFADELAYKEALAAADKKYEVEKGKIAKDEREKRYRDELEGMDQLIQSVAQVGNALHNALNVSADSFIAKMLAALQIILQISKTQALMDTGKLGSTEGTIGIFSSVLGLLGLGFAGGGYTGNMPRNRVAGVVHGGEIVFEKPIVDRYGAQLMALRSQMQAMTSRPALSLPGYGRGGMVGVGSPMVMGGGGMYVTGKLDLSNGQAFLRIEMPGYERFAKSKKIKPKLKS